ncbi:MAG: helix-turn-helix domain-containing protein [Sphaerochaeta sp.]|jgi:DNA-binding XRE family transcriptional regulator|nr:helix-turn-helix domain-containing protein [Sphaerochaeta sp.]
MLAVVKKLPMIDIRMKGDIPEDIVVLLKKHYGSDLYIEDDDQYMSVAEMPWFKEMDAEMSPGKTLRFHRRLANMTQKQLADTLGVAKQYVCDLENGRKAISKAKAKQLAEIFLISPARFI